MYELIVMKSIYSKIIIIIKTIIHIDVRQIKKIVKKINWMVIN